MDTALIDIAHQLVAPGKGILAADESSGTIKKRFDSVGIEDTIENHRKYRQLLFTTRGIEDFISGVILYDETIRQSSDDGKTFPALLSEKGIVPGIKVDQGLEEAPGLPGEKITKGIDGLSGRLKEYKSLGAKFTKWRAAFTIGDGLPTSAAIEHNASLLSEFARISQEEGFVPIVEPEVLMEGSHSLNDSELATVRVLKKVFEMLSEKKVDPARMLLKPNWVHPGLELGQEPHSRDVAQATLRVLREIIPDELPGIVFLSGGDSPKDSTAHLDALNEEGNIPWQLSFSFGRALQEPVLKTWLGKDENKEAAQKEFYKRAKLNSEARFGRYEESMEK